jgi:transposase-like protein
MAKRAVKCIHCGEEKVIRNGKSKSGKQRYKCKECGKRFQVEYRNNGSKPSVRKMIIKMSINGSGIRDISRVLEISTDTVISVLKKLKNT